MKIMKMTKKGKKWGREIYTYMSATTSIVSFSFDFHIKKMTTHTDRNNIHWEGV